MARKKKAVEPLGTIWRADDDLWAVVAGVLADLDPPHRGHRPRIDPRRAPDGSRSRRQQRAIRIRFHHCAWPAWFPLRRYSGERERASPRVKPNVRHKKPGAALSAPLLQAGRRGGPFAVARRPCTTCRRGEPPRRTLSLDHEA